MNKCLESCTGIGVIEWERDALQDIPENQRIAYIEQNAQKLREQYCSEVCPVAKFRRKYERK
jgi:hypothetical protein